MPGKRKGKGRGGVARAGEGKKRKRKGKKRDLNMVKTLEVTSHVQEIQGMEKH